MFDWFDSCAASPAATDWKNVSDRCRVGSVLRPLISVALMRGKHDSDLGRGNDFFCLKKLISLSLSSLGLWAERVSSSLKALRSLCRSSLWQTILGFLPILFSLSAAIDSIVLLISGYISKTALKCSTDSENKLQYVSALTLATRRALVNRHISMVRQSSQEREIKSHYYVGKCLAEDVKKIGPISSCIMLESYQTDYSSRFGNLSKLYPSWPYPSFSLALLIYIIYF